MSLALPAHDSNGIKHFTYAESGHLNEILQQVLNLDREIFFELLNLGAIYVNNKRQSKNKVIPANSAFRIHTRPKRYNCDFDWKSLIVFENDFCLVLNKPSGIPSHPTVDNEIENAMVQTSRVRRYPLFVTHRLDTLTSGLIVYGKKSSFVKSFNLQLQARQIHKKYVALVEGGKIFPQKLTHFMNPSMKSPKILSDQPVEGWPVCELEIIEQKILPYDATWLKILLVTGRTHQIRAQLSHLQAPILGDFIYGASRPYQNGSIALKSCEIEFMCGDQKLKFNLDEDFSF